MKRHDVLAALAAAAGIALAGPASAGVASNAKPALETLADLQQQISDEAVLSQMIQLAKASGQDRGSKSGKSDKGKSSKAGKSDGKGHQSQGHGKGHGKGKGKGHGKGHYHPS